MRRREFIKVVVGSAVAAWPFTARAQQPLPVVGFLNVASPDDCRPMAAAFGQGMKEVGYVEGQNVRVEYRWAEHRANRLPGMAADLVSRQVDVIAATSTPAALAAQAATKTIPIVFETGADPVRLGLVASLNQPGGNITGVTGLNVGLVPKEMEAFHELLPAMTTVGLLVNPADPALAETQLKEATSAARSLGLELHVLGASNEKELEGVFSNLIQLRLNGLVICPEPFFTSHSEQLAELATRHTVPVIYRGREFVAAGGLLGYGTSITDTYRLAGIYTGQILKGKKPAELPVQQATKIELYINLKSAKALGINVPLPLSGRADEVIE